MRSTARRGALVDRPPPSPVATAAGQAGEWSPRRRVEGCRPARRIGADRGVGAGREVGGRLRGQRGHERGRAVPPARHGHRGRQHLRRDSAHRRGRPGVERAYGPTRRPLRGGVPARDARRRGAGVGRLRRRGEGGPGGATRCPLILATPIAIVWVFRAPLVAAWSEGRPPGGMPAARAPARQDGTVTGPPAISQMVPVPGTPSRRCGARASLASVAACSRRARGAARDGAHLTMPRGWRRCGHGVRGGWRRSPLGKAWAGARRVVQRSSAAGRLRVGHDLSGGRGRDTAALWPPMPRVPTRPGPWPPRGRHRAHRDGSATARGVRDGEPRSVSTPCTRCGPPGKTRARSRPRAADDMVGDGSTTAPALAAARRRRGDRRPGARSPPRRPTRC